ncbi:MAG TPA: methyltransferase domain-containing protein [Polyangia bacterium]|jgi:SAM-dependent methyltransferase|nr:methyltransferase domain-containing protein [Polyangia bacterium]
MPERSAPSSSSLNAVWNRRLPLYAYLEPLFAGRRVLEIGCGPGGGAEYLVTHGADRVVAIDTDPAMVERARARYRRPLLEFRTVSHLGDVGVAGETFDVIIVPAADALLRRGELLAAWKRALVDGGRLLLSVTSADHRPAGGFPQGEGIGYYELSDALAGHFPRVQLFGQTPFLGFGIIEFDSTVQGLRVDSRLIEGGAEPTTHYLAVAGTEQALELGYALVQIPFGPVETALAAVPALAAVEPAGVGAGDPTQNERRLEEAERRARIRLEEAEGRISELRRRADDSTVQAESAMRIARAQGEEIEELRGRLRRASEDRSALDVEIAKLRRALAEADESVMSLTRRTAEEMAFVAQTLATGFRNPAVADGTRASAAAQNGDRLSEYATLRDEVDRLRAMLDETEARAAAAERRLEEVAASGREQKEESDDLRARLRRAEESTTRERREIAALQEQLRAAGAETEKLADREETLLERDERIALLEGEKQDLSWRMAELEEKLRTAIGRVVGGDRAGNGSAGNGSEDLAALRTARDRAQDEFRKAAAAHVEEATRLKLSVAEQSALVSELEDALKVVEARADAATREAKALRDGAKELEEADRSRRSRLAELEGKLLRLQHEKGAPARSPADEQAAQKLQDAARERDGLRVALEQASRALNDGDAAHRARLEALDRELGMVRAELAAAQAHAAAHPAGSNGKDAVDTMIPVVASELVAIEVELRDELRTLVRLEGALQDEIDELGRQVVAGTPAAVSPAAAAEMPRSAYVDDNGEVILLHTTLANFRRRAARLRDETEGLRRRLDSLSPSEVSGFLEELGEDLAEFEK